MEQDEEEDDEEVGVISVTPLCFPRQLMAVPIPTTPLVPAFSAPLTTTLSIPTFPIPHMYTMADVHIPGFG